MSGWRPDRLLAGFEARGLEPPGDHGGQVVAALRSDVAGVWLHSPFFEWRVAAWRRPQLHVEAAIGRFSPLAKSLEALPRGSTESLLAAGWVLDVSLKPIEAFPVYLGWIGSMCDAHARVQRGLAVACPVLSMHSDEADVGLDWRHIARYSRGLGPDVAVLAFPGALHDLVLSRPEIREEVFRQLFAWTARVPA